MHTSVHTQAQNLTGNGQKQEQILHLHSGMTRSETWHMDTMELL